MDIKASSSSVSSTQEAANRDELLMYESLLFSNTLKDLKNLRKQLYSAAEYFEISYRKEEQKQIALEILKDYAIKALINTVDHLGSVAYKVNSFLGEKIGEVSATELQVSCLGQRIQTWQDYIIRSGYSQQALIIKTPQHHKSYIFQDEEKMDAVGSTKLNYQVGCVDTECNLHRFKGAVQATIKSALSSFLRVRYPALQSPQLFSRQRASAFTRTSMNKTPEKTAASPQRFPLMGSGSFLRRSVSPNTTNFKQWCPSEPRRSVSLSMFAERDRVNDMEQYSCKNKRLFKALLSMRKSGNCRSKF